MMSKQNQYVPQTVSHPGETLAEKLDEMSMTQKEFAIRTNKPEQTIIKIINGKSSITTDMAIQFENVLNIPASFWTNKQRNYDEAVARLKNEDIIAAACDWAKNFPYAEMARAGWVQKTVNIKEKAEALLAFFGISNHQAWQKLYYEQEIKVSFRISLAHTNAPYAVAAWLRKGEVDATNLNVKKYSARKFKSNLEAIKEIMANHPDNFFELLQNACTDAGVKVVYTPGLPKAPIHGSTRWLGDTPLIQLSARYKQNDRFWFTFFHEAGHILLHGKKFISIENIKYSELDQVKEGEADAFAISWVFSEEQEREVMKSKILTETKILKFAEKFGTHPAMIIGRLQHKNILDFSQGRQFMKAINLDK